MLLKIALKVERPPAVQFTEDPHVEPETVQHCPAVAPFALPAVATQFMWTVVLHFPVGLPSTSL